MNLREDSLASTLFNLLEGLIGETVPIVTKAVIGAIRSGAERITKAGLSELHYVPISQRRSATLCENLL